MVAVASNNAPIQGKPLGLCCVEASALIGLEAHSIRVEVCCTRGPSLFQLVGLADAAVREARVRITSSLARLGILVDEYALTVNLAPADLRKTGASLDVAMALGVLGAIGKLDPKRLAGVLVLGELSLGGELQPVRGVLPQLEGARSRGLRVAIVPRGNTREAGLVEGVQVLAAEDLAAVYAHLLGEERLPEVPLTDFQPESQESRDLDLSDVRGQSLARRALEVVAAGGHNLLMIGPPGGGKTLLARLLPSILPPLSFSEAIEATAIHSVAGLIEPSRGVVSRRPFRAPHHSVSDAALVGGGELPRPGEVSLAHHGVLFLDELAEFRRSTLESLRQPLEDGTVLVSRARARAVFPARAMVVAAVNPCPCGYYGHPRRHCRCGELQRKRYLSRLSGPLLDRLDVHVSVQPVAVEALTGKRQGETSAQVRARVIAARQRQAARQAAGETRAACNAQLSAKEVELVAQPDRDATTVLTRSVNQLGLSARAFVRVLRVARSIADLEGDARVRKSHVIEAVQGRLLDREPI
ncbi:MAG: YifB family Mg chelatase-like AAA ATPase [Polyangiaceae bacterium]